uniref:FAM171 N-terminal domain-containing protein n=1 Tax=Ornithorhynchus anatinus TaxID=9258 RepID=A0A6I8NNW1_ORNAN
IFAGTRPEPHAHFPRRALKLPEDAGYGNLTAFLTAASSPLEARSFPYLQGLDGNGTGNGTRYDLTPVTAISVQLLNNDGAPVPVEGPIFFTVPLPTYSNLKHNAYVTAWRFDPKLGKPDSSTDGLIAANKRQRGLVGGARVWKSEVVGSDPDSATCPLCDFGHVTSLLWASVTSSGKWGSRP